MTVIIIVLVEAGAVQERPKQWHMQFPWHSLLHPHLVNSWQLVAICGSVLQQVFFCEGHLLKLIILFLRHCLNTPGPWKDKIGAGAW